MSSKLDIKKCPIKWTVYIITWSVCVCNTVYTHYTHYILHHIHTSHTPHQFFTFLFHLSHFPATSCPTPNSSLFNTPHQTPHNLIFNIILYSYITSYLTPYNLIINTISHLIHSPILIPITIFHFLVSVSYFLNLIHHTIFPYNSILHIISIIT